MSKTNVAAGESGADQSVATAACIRVAPPCRPSPAPAIVTTPQGCTNNNGCEGTQPFTSGRVRTKLSPVGSWRYGRVEVRAQLPRGNFLWPAIWMLPTDNAYGKWWVGWNQEGRAGTACDPALPACPPPCFPNGKVPACLPFPF